MIFLCASMLHDVLDAKYIKKEDGSYAQVPLSRTMTALHIHPVVFCVCLSLNANAL